MITQMTNNDYYALSRVLALLPPDDEVAVSAPVQMLVAMAGASEQGRTMLTGILRETGQLGNVLASDPTKRPKQRTGDVVVPELPPSLLLNEAQERAAYRATPWLSDARKWAEETSPLTPPNMLETGLIATVGMILSRRVALNVSHGPIYPNLYVLWVAPTSYFAKSTGLALVQSIVQTVAPHLLLPNSLSPEALISKLAGAVPPNYDSLNSYEQRLENDGKTLAAQRCMIVDEVTKFVAPSQEYMKPITEVILEAYDPNPRITHELKKEGKLVIIAPSLSILGATTPSQLAKGITQTDWDNGKMARFMLIDPAIKKTAKRPETIAGEVTTAPPESILGILRKIYAALPEPQPGSSDGSQSVRIPTINAKIDIEGLTFYNRYADALRGMLAPEASLVPNQLRGNYSRLPTMLLKIALISAALRWGGEITDEIKIRESDVHRAFLICEKARRGAHSVLKEMSISAEQRNQDAIMSLLAVNSSPLTKRDFMRILSIPTSKMVDEALKPLIESGDVSEMVIVKHGKEIKQFVRTV